MRPRPTQAYLTYVEEDDGSETQQVQSFPASQWKIGEKVRLGAIVPDLTPYSRLTSSTYRKYASGARRYVRGDLTNACPKLLCG